jgi:phage terminase large subunit-like protein
VPKPGELWPTHGQLAARWIERFLIHGDGDFYGRPFRLRDDQKLFLLRWYEVCPGCGHWRRDRGLKGAATGDGKTEFIAAIACLEFAGPPEIAVPSPNIPIGAASFEQADLLFHAAAIMLGGRDESVKEAPLCGYFNVYDTEIMFADGTPGRMHRVAAVAGTNEGGLPSLFIADELHEWGDVGSRKARVHVVIGKSTRKRMTPRGPGRRLNLSTAGFDVDHSLLGVMYKHGKRCQRDPRLDPKFLFDWREAADTLDLNKPADREIAVRSASAAADVLWSTSARVRAWDEPDMPHHEWIRYFGNRWVDVAEDSWLSEDPTAWDECLSRAKIPKHAEIVVAVDMALKRDSVAVGWFWRRKKDSLVVCRGKIWEPDDRKIDHLDVMDHIRSLANDYTITEVTYDPRFFEVPARILEDEGFNMLEFPQSVERMAPACGLALEKIRSRAVAHDGDPDMSAHVKAAAKRPGERGFTLSKGKSKRHIDYAITLSIGIYRLFAPDMAEPVPTPFVVYA